MVRTDGNIAPFSRDKLMLSLYKSLAHRKTALADAAELSNTVISALRDQQTEELAVIERESVLACSQACLERFDNAASSHYRAYHASA